MSIEMQNPQTIHEKIDAAWNLVEQMSLAHKIKNDDHFNICHEEAVKLLSEVATYLDVNFLDP